MKWLLFITCSFFSSYILAASCTDAEIESLKLAEFSPDAIYDMCGIRVDSRAEKLKVENGCNFFSEISPRTFNTFSSTGEAIASINQIVDAVHLEPNFEIRAGDVPNALATIVNQERFIVYNPDFIYAINIEAGTKWAAISVLAHEVAHHLNGHTLTRSHSKQELEADRFSGAVLQKLGASLEDTTAAMRMMNSPGSASHPSSKERIAVISQAWKESCHHDSACNGDLASTNLRLPELEPISSRPNPTIIDRQPPPMVQTQAHKVRYASVCVVLGLGSCPMAIRLPLGADCTCTGNYGVFSGIAR